MTDSATTDRTAPGAVPGETFTPGPWRISKVDPHSCSDWTDAGGYEISAFGVDQICYVWNASNRIPVDGSPQSDGPAFGSPSGEADARLIAAAPELAAAAADVLSYRVEGSTRGDLRDNDNSRRALARLAAALSRATEREARDAGRDGEAR